MATHRMSRLLYIKINNFFLKILVLPLDYSTSKQRNIMISIIRMKNRQHIILILVFYQIVALDEIQLLKLRQTIN